MSKKIQIYFVEKFMNWLLKKLKIDKYRYVSTAISKNEGW